MAAKSPLKSPLKSLCERYNAVLEDMLLKVTCDKSTSLDISLQWIINSKNSVPNIHGFLPYQLVFGKNPDLPSVLTTSCLL